MSIHRPPTDSNVFNPSDFASEIDDDNIDEDDDEDHLLVSGDEMIGQLYKKQY